LIRHRDDARFRTAQGAMGDEHHRYSSPEQRRDEMSVNTP
jgi:hypothetical protein